MDHAKIVPGTTSFARLLLGVRAHHRVRAFTIMEVMVSMVILAIVMSAVISGLYSTNMAHRANREMAKVREIAQVMAERIMGAAWGNLGRKMAIPGSNGWSWHRRAAPAFGATAPDPNEHQYGFFGPLVEKPTNPDFGETTPGEQTHSRDLLVQGILAEPSGIQDLRVYLEYYNDRVVPGVSQTMTTGGTQIHQAWIAEMGDYFNHLPPTKPGTTLAEDHNLFNLGAVDRAVVVRILVNWTDCYGAPRWHQVMLARRK